MTEDEMAGWHHCLNEHEFEQAPGDGEGQESLACYSPRDHKESDTTEWLNNKGLISKLHKQLIQLNIKNNSIKMGRRPKQTFSKEDKQ